MAEARAKAPAAPGTRWLYVAVGFVLLLFLGLIYAWSIFVAPLEGEFGWSRSETSMAFTICMCMFCIGGFVTGLLSRRRPPALAIRLCAVFVLAGFLLTSRVNSLPMLYISYGGFVGFGVGLAYNAVISTVTKWFPDKTGLISGLLLMGFGAGGMVLGTVSTSLMGILGWRGTFAGIGVVFFALILAASFLIKPPPEGYARPGASATQEAANEFETREMLRQPSFWLFFLWEVLLTAAGLALIGHASPCAVDMGILPAKAAFYAGLISICNGGGRVVVGAVFDKLGRRLTMLIVSGGFVVSGLILMLALSRRSEAILVAGYVCTGLSYGGVMPCNSTVTGKFFGRANYSMNFSMVNMNILIASPLGPYLAGVLQGMSGSYFTTFVTMAVFGGLAFLLNLLIRQPQKKTITVRQ